MNYMAYFGTDQIAFMEGDIFVKRNRVFIRNARNCGEESDRAIPREINLENIEMDKEEKSKIKNRFLKTKKQNKKTRRPMMRH